MVIVRDGEVYVLTRTEAYEIYREIKRELLIEDIKSKAIDNNVDLTDVDIDRIADKAERAIDRDDYLWDNYWHDIDYALKDI